MKKTYKIDVDCAACADKMELAAKGTAGVRNANVNFMMLQMRVEFEDGADAGPGLLLDVMVGIDETQAETVGQAATDRGLARAHRADQDEVGGGIHGPGC